jgi:hypothetical protein
MLRSLGLAFEGDNNASNRRKKTPAKRTKPWVHVLKFFYLLSGHQVVKQSNVQT